MLTSGGAIYGEDDPAGSGGALTVVYLLYVAAGRGLRREQVEKAIRLSQDKYCSIAGMLRPTVRITSEVVVRDVAGPGTVTVA